jgi:hypothetical protein
VLKRTLFSSVIAGIVVAAFVWTPVFGGQTPKLSFKSKLGPDKNVPADSFRVAKAKCPRGWAATGGGLYLGAIEPVVDGPTFNGRGWFSDGYNPSTTTNFSHAVEVRCVKGKNGIKVNAKKAPRDLILEARQAFLEGER